MNLNLSRQQNTGTKLGDGTIHNHSQSQSVNLGTGGLNLSFGSEDHKRESSINLDNGALKTVILAIQNQMFSWALGPPD